MLLVWCKAQAAAAAVASDPAQDLWTFMYMGFSENVGTIFFGGFLY